MSSLLLTTPPNTSPPLLRLPSELHLAIISFLPDLKDAKGEHDLALLQLRRTNRYFRNLVPPPTHNDLLSLELALCKYSVYACKFCLRLQPKTKFAYAMLKGKTGVNGKARDRRFCAECGFDTTEVGQSQRYCPGTKACVNGVNWIWCKRCKIVKKGEEATSVCVGLCKECCRCSLEYGSPLHLRALTPLRTSSRPPEASSGRIRLNTSDEDSDGDDKIDEYDFWEEQFQLVQQEDDDWRAL
ncbi:hypothetical protein BU24DRAFT_199136 [Aaosphaeria arxii CBS 175.79]|uniref:F-box domain-containing protein n=1 Tax=Aaosphaeria arxii CBS 175.79 TaxID=1450172 RepID=A0A6A5XU31_9PLEO|nr:uncharacterized protein BU24DRAFT_199136 [Aaosphaeria arxii CBS 175.79]KAF2016317.1 hypothetical protein BU24DRAFT_199136 [Aaosphaeria arxii CBS 175.79]